MPQAHDPSATAAAQDSCGRQPQPSHLPPLHALPHTTTPRTPHTPWARKHLCAQEPGDPDPEQKPGEPIEPDHQEPGEGDPEKPGTDTPAIPE